MIDAGECWDEKQQPSCKLIPYSVVTTWSASCITLPFDLRLSGLRADRDNARAPPWQVAPAQCRAITSPTPRKHRPQIRGIAVPTRKVNAERGECWADPAYRAG